MELICPQVDLACSHGLFCPVVAQPVVKALLVLILLVVPPTATPNLLQVYVQIVGKPLLERILSTSRLK